VVAVAALQARRRRIEMRYATDRGRVVHRDGDLVFLEAVLVDGDDAPIATATATARVIALADARAAA
jgi:hypothetical protein